MTHQPIGGHYGERMCTTSRTTSRTPSSALAVVLLAAVLGLTSCGSEEPGKESDADATAAAECHQQWEEVGQSVLGLDRETTPSSLASRWTAVIASVDYYENSEPTDECLDLVEKQTKEISSLRQFSEKLRPYDMSYQLDQVRAAIDLYLHDPLPEPTRDQNGKPVRPPSKEAVVRGFRTLTAQAAVADSDLEAGWKQMSTVPLDDVEALRKAVTDLDDLAHTSEAWLQCEAALQVLVAAIRAQEGLAP